MRCRKRNIPVLTRSGMTNVLVLTKYCFQMYFLSVILKCFLYWKSFLETENLTKHFFFLLRTLQSDTENKYSPATPLGGASCFFFPFFLGTWSQRRLLLHQLITRLKTLQQLELNFLPATSWHSLICMWCQHLSSPNHLLINTFSPGSSRITTKAAK